MTESGQRDAKFEPDEAKDEGAKQAASARAAGDVGASPSGSKGRDVAPTAKPTASKSAGDVVKRPGGGGGGPVGPARKGARPNRQGKARPRLRHKLAILSFILLVLLPAGVANWYLHERAADQFASSLAFTIQSDDGPAVSLLEGFLAGSSGGMSADQTEVLYGFIRSQNMVEKLLARFDLRAIYNKHPEDWWYSLGDDQAIDHLVEYWKSVCIVSFAGGIVHVEVRAFSAEDARMIAQAVLEESTAQINRMSAEARDDALRDSVAYLNEKEQNLRDARMALQTERQRQESFSPELEAPQVMERIGQLEAQLQRARIRLDELRQFAPPGDSRITTTERRIETLVGLIAEERSKISSDGGGSLSSADVGRFEALQVDQEIALTAYNAALASYENARIEARRKQSYLSAHISPTLSDEPQYPERYFVGGLVLIGLFLGWMVLMMIAYNIKDRR